MADFVPNFWEAERYEAGQLDHGYVYRNVVPGADGGLYEYYEWVPEKE